MKNLFFAVVTPELVASIEAFCTILCELLIHGKATANAAPVDQAPGI